MAYLRPEYPEPLSQGPNIQDGVHPLGARTPTTRGVGYHPRSQECLPPYHTVFSVREYTVGEGAGRKSPSSK